MPGKVSLIIPIYNAEKYLQDSLTTILRQDYENVEIIVVNDASTDATENILNDFEKKFREKGFSYIIVNRERNGGLCAAINSGLLIASGEYLCFPDADDELSPNYISSMVFVLEKNKYMGWVRCNYTIVLEEENREYDVILPKQSVYQNDYYDFISKLVPHNAWNMMVKREYFETCIGKQIIDSRLTQEWALLLPLSYVSNYGRCRDVLYRYHIRKGAMSSWQNGKIEEVIKHFDDLKELNFKVLSKINVLEQDMKLSVIALEIYYSLAKIKKYNALDMREKSLEEQNKLKGYCNSIFPWKVAELIDNYDLYTRFVFDVLLKMNLEQPKKNYENCKKMLLEGRYVVCFDRPGEKMYKCLCAAFGIPYKKIDCTYFANDICEPGVMKVCLIENSGKYSKLIADDLDNKNQYIDYRVLRDAVRAWAYIVGGETVEYEVERICCASSK